MHVHEQTCHLTGEVMQTQKILPKVAYCFLKYWFLHTEAMMFLHNDTDRGKSHKFQERISCSEASVPGQILCFFISPFFQLLLARQLQNSELRPTFKHFPLPKKLECSQQPPATNAHVIIYTDLRSICSYCIIQKQREGVFFPLFSVAFARAWVMYNFCSLFHPCSIPHPISHYLLVVVMHDGIQYLTKLNSLHALSFSSWPLMNTL